MREKMGGGADEGKKPTPPRDPSWVSTGLSRGQNRGNA